MNARHVLLAVALAFGVWEATDVPDTGAPALVFSVLFVAAALWLWRRRSTIGAPVLIALLCAVEASQAHTWKDTGPTAKLAAEILGSVGIVAALAVVVPSIWTARSRTS